MKSHLDSLLEPEARASSEDCGSAAPFFRFLDLKAQFEEIRDEVMQAVSRVLESQRFILGAEVEAFENEMAQMSGVRAAVGCASGSDALLLALMALGIGPGDEVIVPAFTFVATAGSVARLGAKPVFVDILPDTLNIDPAQVEQVVTARTRAIIPVHLFGLPAELDALLKIAEAKNVPVVEDAAQAIGARYYGKQVGSLGQFGCFSFYPSKNLGGAGDGGMVTTNSPETGERLRILRDHGATQKYSYELVGINSRLDALQAAILRVKLRHLVDWTEARRRNSNRYRTLFAQAGVGENVTLPAEPHHCYHVYNQFTIRVRERDRLRKHLNSQGIPTEIYYPSPLHLQLAFQYLGYKTGQCPEAEAACREAVSLPIYPELTERHLEAVVATVTDFYQSAN